MPLPCPRDHQKPCARHVLQELLKPHTFFKGLLPGILNDLPGLLFFTTYTLLVLFWAEIYHQAKGQTTSRLRPTFLATNIFVYAVQAILVFLSSFKHLQAPARVRYLPMQLPCTSTNTVSANSSNRVRLAVRVTKH